MSEEIRPSKPMTLPFDLIVEADGWPDADQLSSVITRVIDALARDQKLQVVRRVCFLFTDDIALAELNRLHRGKPGPTNVLSFPAHESAADELGDIALARETLFREADEKSISVTDHIAHLVVHGVLHLLGYDHETQLEAETMEAIERETLSRIGIADPYQGDR
jgi:probable rRNA maturation factor